MYIHCSSTLGPICIFTIVNGEILHHMYKVFVKRIIRQQIYLQRIIISMPFRYLISLLDIMNVRHFHFFLLTKKCFSVRIYVMICYEYLYKSTNDITIYSSKFIKVLHACSSEKYLSKLSTPPCHLSIWRILMNNKVCHFNMKNFHESS